MSPSRSPRAVVTLSVIPVLLLMVGAILTTAGVTANDDDGGAGCKQIRVRFVQRQVTANCASPFGFCSLGQIGSGLLKGTKSFTATAVAPSAGLGAAEPPTTSSYAGPVLISTERGNLNVRFVGLFDTAAGIVSELGRVTGGSGRFAGATGTLFAHASASADNTVFDTTLTGEVCVLG